MSEQRQETGTIMAITKGSTLAMVLGVFVLIHGAALIFAPIVAVLSVAAIAGYVSIRCGRFTPTCCLQNIGRTLGLCFGSSATVGRPIPDC
jgi:hypothetical protein